MCAAATQSPPPRCTAPGGGMRGPSAQLSTAQPAHDQLQRRTTPDGRGASGSLSRNAPANAANRQQIQHTKGRRGHPAGMGPGPQKTADRGTAGTTPPLQPCGGSATDPAMTAAARFACPEMGCAKVRNQPPGSGQVGSPPPKTPSMPEPLLRSTPKSKTFCRFFVCELVNPPPK